MKRLDLAVSILVCCAGIGLAQSAAPVAWTTNAVLPGVGNTLRIVAVCGAVGGRARVTLNHGMEQITLTGDDCPEQNKHYPLTKIPQGIQLKDGVIAVAMKTAGLRFGYYVRPNIRFYRGKDFEEGLQRWDWRSAASTHAFALDLRRTAAGVEWWLDGRYLATTPLEGEVAEIDVTLTQGAALQHLNTVADPLPSGERLLPIDLAGYRICDDESPFGLLQVAQAADRKPFPWLDAAARLDVGRSRWLGQAADSGSFYDRYYVRGAFDGLPESLILRVPKRAYTKIWLLCAVDPAASPWMTVRIGRYRETWDGSGMSVGDTQVKVDPDDAVGVLDLRIVGTTTLQRGEETIRVPLYRIAVPLATDQVADYLQWAGLNPKRQDFGAPLDWFNIEFSRRIETRLTINSGIFDAKPVGAKSGVQIFGVTLQWEPVEVRVKSTEEGFSFYRDRKPRLLLETHNDTPQRQAIMMKAELTDVDGRTFAHTLTFNAAAGVTTNWWPIDDLPLGWYDAQLHLGDARGTWAQKTSLSLALLPPDTRQAGAESPFGTWWFQGSHYTEPDPARMLPLLAKLGFRHVTPNVEGDAALFARYQVTPSMMGYKRNLSPSNAVPAATFMTNWPAVKTAMIFHETTLPEMSTALPYELTGAPPPTFSESWHDKVQELRARIETYVATVRSIDPDMKFMVGNGSTSFNTLWFRERLPTNLWDFCGMEMGIQTLHPESQPTGWNLQSFWIARQMADAYGYTNFPISTCYEVGYRATGPGGLSLKRQADWYARDVLHMLAWRSPHINVALLADVNASYYTSRWGSTGLFHRSPLHLPKPSFVSLATLTLMLDRADYRRAVPTGSTGVYCLEFARGRETIYAIWCSRGERSMELTLAGSLRHGVDSMGRDLNLKARRKRVTMQASESPVYVVTHGEVTSVTLGTPMHADIPLAEAQVVDAMRDRAAWRLVPEGEASFETYCDYWPMVRGDIACDAAPRAQAAEAEAQGLALTLRPQPDVRPIVARYAVLEPVAGPLPITGTPDTLGVWVNGNSGWGRIYFEFVDAKGRRWRSNRGEGQAWDLSDWEAETSINHDGWRLVALSLPDCYPSGYYTPAMRHWRLLGAAEDAIPEPPAFPIALTRLYVLLREQVVYVTEMTEPASATITLRDITAGRRME